MKILTLIHEYPPIGGGGARVAQDVARGLVKLGHEVHVLAPHMTHMKGLAGRSLDEGVHLIRIPSFRRKAFVGDLPAMSGYLLAGFFAGLWLMFRTRPQVIHVHFAVPAGLLAWVLSKLTGIPYILTSHLGDVPGGVPDKTGRWFRWVYPFTPRIWQDAAAVTAISEFTRHLALSHYPVEIKVIPNGIKVNQHNPKKLEVNTPPSIIFVGRFVHQKNPLPIPQILSRLRDLDWTCTMVGDGVLMDSLVQGIDVLGLNDRFFLHGWRNQDEVKDILSQGDILFMPSMTEGIPLSGLQALVNGLAIVASNVGGMSQLVENNVNGCLHNPSDWDGFERSLRNYLQDNEKLKQARLRSLQKARQFDIELVVKKYEEVILDAKKVIERRTS